MTTEILKEIIEDAKKTKDLLDVEKADLLVYLCNLYEEEAKPIRKEVDKLIDKWD